MSERATPADLAALLAKATRQGQLRLTVSAPTLARLCRDLTAAREERKRLRVALADLLLSNEPCTTAQAYEALGVEIVDCDEPELHRIAAGDAP